MGKKDLYNGYRNIDENEYEDSDILDFIDIESPENVVELKEKLEYEKPDKISIFDKILKFISGKNEKKNYKFYDDIEAISVFDDYVNDINKRDASYKDVRLAATLCEEALRILKQRLILINKSKITQEKLAELKHFEALQGETLEYFKRILNRYVGLVKERNVLRHQVTSFDRAVGELQKLEIDAKFVVDKMEDAENTQRIFRQDINHIETEKIDLEEEEKILRNGKNFFKNFTYVVVTAFVMVTMVLCFMSISQGIDITAATAVMIIAVIILSAFILIFRQKDRQRLKYEYKA